MRFKNKEAEQDFDLNIVPIIDCFTVLVAFMLASTAFLAIGIMDAGLAAGGQTSTQTARPPVDIEVVLQSKNRIAVKVSGKSKQSISIKAGEEKRDFDQLKKRLQSLRSRWKSVDNITLSADQSVQYQDVVESMSAVKEVYPVVMLGGF